MKNIFITLDYELFFGQNVGTLEKSVITPTNKLLEIFNRYNAKVSFMVDSGYLIRLDEFRKKYFILEDDYKKITKQIKDISTQGHDIQLHIHPHWEDSYFDGEKWVLNTSRYRIQKFNKEEIYDIVYRYKKVLTDLTGIEAFVFRAGGWCVQPFEELGNALRENNITLETSVFKAGKNDSATHYFDFTKAPSKDIWKFSNDPLCEDRDGFFTELPISSYKLSPLFFWKLAYAKKLGGNMHKSFGDGNAVGGGTKDKLRMLTSYTNSVVSIDGYKSLYLQKAFDLFKKDKSNKHFVAIGHPKATSEFSLTKLEEFIKNNIDNNFISYSREFK